MRGEMNEGDRHDHAVGRKSVETLSGSHQRSGQAADYFYVSDDVENDVRRCIRSWEHQHSISVTGRTATGEIKCFSGTVEAVARAPDLGAGELWMVTMRELSF